MEAAGLCKLFLSLACFVVACGDALAAPVYQKSRITVLDRIKEKQRLRRRVKFSKLRVADSIPQSVEPKQKKGHDDWVNTVHKVARKSTQGLRSLQHRMVGPDPLSEEIIPTFVERANLPQSITSEEATIVITEFLKQYGYIDLTEEEREKVLHVPRSPRGMAPPSHFDLEVQALDSSISTQLSKMQNKLGLEETGTINTETLQTATLPRCAMEDVAPAMEGADEIGAGNFVLKGAWTKLDLTYCILNYTDRLTPEEVDWSVAKALVLWQESSGLTFKKVTFGEELCDLQIFFARNRHGDKYVFDGMGGVLAHAFYPPYQWEDPDLETIKGDLHFDFEEMFAIAGGAGVDLVQTAAHEFGHAFGLMHSKNKRSVMAPVYRAYDPNFALHQDDIDGIQMLYGEPSLLEEDDEESVASISSTSTTAAATTTSVTLTTAATTTATTTSTTTTSASAQVSRGREMEGVGPGDGTVIVRQTMGTQTKKGTTVEENGQTDSSEEIFSKKEDANEDGVDLNSLEVLQGTDVQDICLFTNVDAIDMDHNGKTIVIIGNNVWHLGDYSLSKYFQRKGELWEGSPGEIDAVLTRVSQSLRVTYVISGTLVWSYINGEPVQNNPQKSDMIFPLIPSKVDAAYVRQSYGRLHPETINVISGCSLYEYIIMQNDILLEEVVNICKILPEVRTPVTGATVLNHRVYWFNEDGYYRIKHSKRTNKLQVRKANPPYPRNVAHYWFGCPLQ